MASAKPLHCSTVRMVSTSTASCSPWISVAELATHIRGSLPGGISRFRPGRVTVNTLYLNGSVLLSELAIAAPGIAGSMTRETSFIISRRFTLILVFMEVEPWASLVRSPGNECDGFDICSLLFAGQQSSPTPLQVADSTPSGHP